MEVAEVELGAVLFDEGGPLSAGFVPGDAFVFRGGVFRGAAVCIVLGEGAIPEVFLSIFQAIVIDVVADEMVGSAGDLPVHIDSFRLVVVCDYADGVGGGPVDFAVPAELRELRIVFGVNLCGPALSERDEAVITEVVGVDWEAVLRGGVVGDVMSKGEAEPATDIVAFDDWPASPVGIEGEDGWIKQAMQGPGDTAGEVTTAAASVSRI